MPDAPEVIDESHRRFYSNLWTWLGPLLLSGVIVLLGVLWRTSEDVIKDTVGTVKQLNFEHIADHTALEVLKTKTDAVSATVERVQDTIDNMDKKGDERWDALHREGIIGNSSAQVGKR